MSPEERKRHEDFEGNPKVQALYRAVSELLEEGADATNLKVADIAARAGIGKGTTYEYFKSREELIIKAMLSRMYAYFKRVTEKTDAKEQFREKVYVFLDSLFTASNENMKSMQQMFVLLSGGGSMPLRFKEELHKCWQPIVTFREYADELYTCAVREGTASPNLPSFYVHTAFLNLLISYGLYQYPSSCKSNYGSQDVAEDGCLCLEEQDIDVQNEEESCYMKKSFPSEISCLKKDEVKQRLYENLVFMLR